MYNLYMTYLGDSVEQWMKWGGYKSGGVLTITLGMNNLSGWERTWKNFRKLTKNRTLYYPALHITSFFFLSHLISFFRDTTTIRLCTSLLALLAQLDRALPPFIAKVGIDSQVHLKLLVCSFTARTTSTFKYLLSQFTSSSSSSYALLTYKIIVIYCRMNHIFCDCIWRNKDLGFFVL